MLTPYTFIRYYLLLSPLISIVLSKAFDEAQLNVKDIDFFGLYDCFPICLLRAVEAVGLAKKGRDSYISSLHQWIWNYLIYLFICFFTQRGSCQGKEANG